MASEDPRKETAKDTPIQLADLMAPRAGEVSGGASAKLIFGHVKGASQTPAGPAGTANPEEGGKMRKLFGQRPPSERPFNMVEIVLALMIVIIGIVGVIGLFPVGQKSGLEARGRNFAVDASNQFSELMRDQIKRHWDLIATLPLAKPASEAGANWQSADGNSVFHDMPGLVIFYNDQDNDKKYDYLLDTANQSRDDSGLFRLEQRTAGGVADFAAILRVWVSAAKYTPYDRGSSAWASDKAVPPDQGLTLNVEVSWPASLPYEKRNKTLSLTDVFRPAANDLAAVQGAFQIGQNGKLHFTYHGSDAALTSGFYMLAPTEQVIFASNKTTSQNTTLDVEWQAGTNFNFYSRTNASSWGLGTYDHYAFCNDPAVCDCKCRTLDGLLNINPSNSSNNEFTLTRGDGSTFTRDDLANASALPADGTFYSGKATYIRVKPKGNGNQNTLTVNGTAYSLLNANAYLITGTDLQVRVYNDKVNNGKAMGKWYLSTAAACGQIRQETYNHDERCPRHPTNLPTVAGSGPPWYHDWNHGSTGGSGPTSARSGAFDYLTGAPYCMVTEMVPGRKWLLSFEDLPADKNHTGATNGSDFDYNDIVVEVELVTTGSSQASSGGHDVSGSIVLNPVPSLDWSFNMLKPDGTIMTKNNMAEYSGAAVSLWFRPRGTGTQSIQKDGVSETVTNADMTALSADHNTLNVQLINSGGTWRLTFTAPNAIYTVLN